MYSYEDRIRAVKLYIKLGKRTSVTIRQLGYPTKKSLIYWYREYEGSRDLRVGYSRVGHKFSEEQKQAAVQHYIDYGRCIAWTIRDLGYPNRATLAAWIDELHPHARQRLVGRAPSVPRPLEVKRKAVIDLCTRQTSAEAIAHDLEVCRPTLYNWKNQLLGRETPASMKRHNPSPSAPDDAQLTDLRQQVESLRNNIRRLQLEQDLLKKANELLK